jgi:hypothetical protein
MKTPRFLTLCALLFAVAVVATGCGKPKVTGKVTFADGSPLTQGTVNFTDDKILCKGSIKEDGTFEMRTLKPGDGVPPGTYKVYLTETTRFGEPEIETSALDANSVMHSTVNDVPPKYSNPEQSGLTIDVKGSMKYDITIETDAE